MIGSNVSTGTPDPRGARPSHFKQVPQVPAPTPITLEPQVEAWITDHFYQELTTAKAARSQLEENWKEWDRQWEARPREKVKSFPWPNASNLELPVAAIVGMTVYSRLLNTMFAHAPFWNIRSENTDYLDMAAGLQRLMEWAAAHELDMFNVVSTCLMDVVRMGTGFIKVPYVKDVRRVRTYDENGALQTKELTVHDGPKPYPVAIHNMFVPRFDIEGVQDQPWISERHVYTFGELKQLELLRKIKNVDKVEHSITHADQRSEARDNLEGVAALRALNSKEYEVHEVWAKFDVENKGLEQDIMILMELTTGNNLGIYYNWYFDNKRPYVKIPYERREHRFYGIGVGGMCETLQDGMSTIANQRIDNATVANTRIWKGRRGSGLKQNEQMWPSRVVLLNNPKEDLIAEQAGEVYPSSMTNESALRDYVERRSAASEFMQGRESEVFGSRATATSTLSLIQEGNKRFDLAMKEARAGLGEVGEMVVCRYHQYKPYHKAFVVLGKEGQKVTELFTFPPDFLVAQMSIQIAASTAALNKEIEKQNRLTLFQLLGDFYTKMFDLFTIITNPASPPALKELAQMAATAGRDFGVKILDDFDVKNPEVYIPSFERLLGIAATATQLQPGGLGGQPTGGLPPGVATPAGVPGATAVGTMAPVPPGPNGGPTDATGQPPVGY